MRSEPKISVITPSFNQAAFLEATLKSVLDQQYPQTELIVMDGGSTDGSADILKKFDARLAHWVSEKDRGQSHAFNKGLAKATGDIIGWLNSDDLYLHPCMREAAEYFAAHPEVDIVFADYIFIDEHGRYLRRRREPAFDFNAYVWTEDCYHANCAGFFRKRVFDRLGGLSEEFHYGMDYELYLRAHREGFRFGHVRSYWGAYRFHSQSKSIAAFDKQQSDARVIFERFRGTPSSGPGFAARKKFYAAQRIVKKALLGSYFPFLSLDRYYRSP